jgi:arylsulfatase A-like enzyme
MRTRYAQVRSGIGPNVLLIVMDTARADAFEPYGATTGSTPAVAQLASSGVCQSFAYAPACWTVPSHASLLSGFLPRDMGLGQAPGGPLGVRPVLESMAEHLLPERLRRAGWHTVGISANHWIAEHSGFATGFDDWHQVVSGRSNQFVGEGLRSRVAWGLECLRAHTDDGAAEAEALIHQLLVERKADQPFFCFVNLIECHSPYLPPKPANDLSPIQRLRAADEARRYLTFLGIIRACTGVLTVPDGAFERMRHLYNRSVHLMDEWLARVLEALDAAGVLDETCVIVTSDHGENLGEGGLLGHAFSLDERLVRVPFIASQKLAEPDRVLSLTDVPHLVADAVGLADHPWNSDGGRSAVAQLDPLAPADDPRIVEFIDKWNLDDEGVYRLTTGAVVATDGRRKLMRRGGQEVLFDLVADPLETEGRVLAAGAADPEIELLRKAAADAEEAKPVPGLRADAPTPTASDEEVARIEEQMRLLGYL